MVAQQDKKSLEKSSGSSEQASQNPSSSVSTDVPLDATTSIEGCGFTESSPAVLPLNAAADLVAASSQQNVCEVQQQMEQPFSPVIDRAQWNDVAFEQQVDEQIPVTPVDDPKTSWFAAFYDCYKYSAFDLRNSSFIYFLQILFSSIPLSAVVVGFVFLKECPKATYLPGLGVGIGFVGLLYLGLWMAISRLNRRGTFCSPPQKFGFALFSILLVSASITDAVQVYKMAPDFDPASKDYCNETFYTYTCYKEVATAIVVVFSYLLHFPGMCHTLFCYRCYLINSGRYYSI